MKRIPFVLLTLCFLMAFFFIFPFNKDREMRKNLWPNIEPFRTEHLDVSEMHRIYFELCGKPDGQPVFVLHGGPGGSCSPYYRRFFNPKKYLIVLHDQRGTGRSEPFGELTDNTTQHLVEDIERLRRHLNLEKIILFGGSWGSTLGLAYAETYPEHVQAMVLRGIFMATKQEIDHFYHGGVRPFFPELYEQYVESIPADERADMPRALSKRVQSDDKGERDAFTKLWATYEMKLATLNTPDEMLNNVDPDEFYALALLENHYMSNGCFLEEGQLLKEAFRLFSIPIILVNGRYDMICPPVNAYRLHKKLAKSELIIVEETGHWMGDEAMESILVQSMVRFE